MKRMAKQKKRKEKNVSDIVKGYKVFESDWVCRGKKYSCPGRFKEEGELEICGNGMHFCRNLIDCFDYYDFDPNNHVAEVIAHGDVIEGTNKCCTNDLEIVREIPWDEVLRIANRGKGCTGVDNDGNQNAGSRNAGNWNTGNSNTGNRNTGNYNTGSYNAGYFNTGSYNTGSRNIRDGNTGNRNNGRYNAGNRNDGNYNAGGR